MKTYKKYRDKVNFYITEEDCYHHGAKMTVFPFLVTDYMANIDVDDICLPDRLWYSCYILSQGYDAVYGKLVTFVDHKYNDEKTKKRLLNYKQNDGFFTQTSSMKRKEVFKEIGGWVDTACSADVDFSMKIKSYNVYESKDPFTLYRLHNKSVSESIPMHGKFRKDIKASFPRKGDLEKLSGKATKI